MFKGILFVPFESIQWSILPTDFKTKKLEKIITKLSSRSDYKPNSEIEKNIFDCCKNAKFDNFFCLLLGA